MRVLLLHNDVPPGAPPDEADVLVQAAAVQSALESGGHEVERLACGLDLSELAAAVRDRRPDAAFNLVESLNGHGRLIHLVPSVLEALGLPLAGCPADAFAVTSHKVLAKRLLAGAGLPTPPSVAADQADDVGMAPPAGATWIIKSVWEDASLGLNDDSLVAGTAAELRKRLAGRAGTPGAPWFAEVYVEGREFNLALLDGPDGIQVLPPAEMLFEDYPDGKPRIVGYAAKWHGESFECRHTVRTFEHSAADRPLVDELKRLALACWRLFGLRGWARVDFRVDAAGKPWILEANVNPCLAPDAGFAAALARADIPFSQAVDRILAAAG